MKIALSIVIFFVSVLIVANILSKNSVLTHTFGATNLASTPLTSSFLNSRSSSTYQGSINISCTKPVHISDNCLAGNGVYFSRTVNNKELRAEIYTTSTIPFAAVQNLVCANEPNTICSDDQGHSVTLWTCDTVTIPQGC